MENNTTEIILGGGEVGNQEVNPFLDVIDRLPPKKPLVITPRNELGHFLQGSIGNPEGRPLSKRDSVTSQLRVLLDMSPEEIKTFKPETGAQVIALSMYNQSIKEPQVLRETLNRVEGKVAEMIDMQTTGVSILYELTKPREDDGATKEE